ncbi:MAG: DUF7674 family protein [Acutalibacteraceae bacterium]|jgi:hypothetical protein
MADIYTALTAIIKGMEDSLKTNGFQAVYPAGVKRGELPAVTQGDRITVDFTGEKGSLRLRFFDEKIALLFASGGSEASESDFKQLALSLLDPETADDKDLRYISGELSETLNNHCGAKTGAETGGKLPVPVSKAAAKSGALAYDPNTLGNRFTVLYPELREAYKQNVEKYGEFLAEDFFLSVGNRAVISTVKSRDNAKIKKLFNLLNEIYEDGTNETQSIIAVTILGSFNNDQELLANCVEFMSTDLIGPVLQVNKYLASRGGKGARMRLENPPPYKPKKQRKNPFTSSLGL